MLEVMEVKSGRGASQVDFWCCFDNTLVVRVTVCKELR